MNKLANILLLFTALVTLSSCFKDEEPNTECDILQAWVHVDDPKEVFFQDKDSIINVLYSKSTIEFSVRRKADITCMAPQFAITPGATISPASGSVQDFSDGPVTYTVTSEDGAWTRKYEVSFKQITVMKSDTVRFDFENFEINEAQKEKYYRWYETDLDGQKVEYWSSANAGFALAKGSATALEYPTAPCDGYQGKGVALITRNTGSFGTMVNKRLAAGNFFIGEFDPTNALTQTLLCTCMGRPFANKPVTFSCYYKYTPGAQMQNKAGKPIDGVDEPAMYAVFYLNHDENGNEVMLHGDDIRTSPYIVGVADLKTIPAVTEWTKYEVPFEYYKEVDQNILDNRGYNIAIVFSSSKNGDFYEGAIGSTLCIDNVRLACEKEE